MNTPKFPFIGRLTISENKIVIRDGLRHEEVRFTFDIFDCGNRNEEIESMDGNLVTVNEGQRDWNRTIYTLSS